jgi:formylglycine-generating enzyme required for sulfatase activity
MKKTFTIALLVSVFFVLGLSKLAPNPKKAFEKFLKTSAYTFIPEGKVFVNNQEKSVNGFYISKGEVTNRQYKEFLKYLKDNNEIEKLKICQIDSSNWSTENSFSVAFVSHYHSHPSYYNYPVVNISHEAAELYCGFISAALSINFPGIIVTCRLPSYTEYVRAARGDDPNMSYGWNSSLTRNKDGQILGNFTRLGEECITRNKETGKFEVSLSGLQTHTSGSFDILAPSESYWPNQFGVYNLSGNAAEMISEKGIAVGGSWKNPGYDVRIDSKTEFSESDKTVGFRVVFDYSCAGE